MSKEAEGWDLCSGTYQNVEAYETLAISKVHRKIALLPYEIHLEWSGLFLFYLKHCES